MSIRKIAVRGGHNFQARGAVGIIDETVEDRKVYKALIKYLKMAGFEVLDVTPNDCDVNADLAYGVNKAEAWGADLFLSVHFDKAYDRYEGALGTGTWICATGGEAEVYAKRIVDNLAKGTGFKNRGVKTNSKLYELRKTTMPAVIIEVCFCEATEDVRIYNEKGYNLIGKLIAEGVANSSIGSSPEPETPAEDYKGFYLTDEKRVNATLVGSGSIKVLDANCKEIPNRYIDSLDRLFILGIYPSYGYIEVVYPAGGRKYHAYIDVEYYNRLSFDFHKEYINDDGETYVWWSSKDVNVKEHNEVLKPHQVASPMYRTDGWLRITFYRENGVPSDGYVRYEGSQGTKFYEEAKLQYGKVKVNSSLNVRDKINGKVIGSVYNNEKVLIKWTENGHYYIEYDTSSGKKQGYVSAKYVELI